MVQQRVLIYGAGGRTGQAIARHAKKRGLDIVLAGRRMSAVAGLAQSLGCGARAAGVDDAAALDAMLEDVAVVINAAGPYAVTASPIVKACIARKCHYVDVSGEVGAYMNVHDFKGKARRAGILLLPGAGYCVIASTFLLASLLEDPDAAPSMRQPTRLRIAFCGGPASSVGSIKSLFTSLYPGVDVVQDGGLTQVPIGSLERAFDFGRRRGRLDCTAIGVADTVAAMFDAPALGQIESYVEGTLPTRAFFEASGRFTRFSKVQPWKTWVELSMRQWPATPDSGVDTRSVLRVEVDNVWLQTRSAVLLTPSTYEFTAIAASTIAELIVAGVGVQSGFHTPASLYYTNATLRRALKLCSASSTRRAVTAQTGI